MHFVAFSDRGKEKSVGIKLSLIDPDNSVLCQGKRIKYFQVYRWDPDQSSRPTIATYPVDLAQCGPMVLDALLKVDQNLLRPLRFSNSPRV